MRARVGSAKLLQQKALLKARLRAAPNTPGVYLFRGADGQVLYVGKSANLRDRLRSYFTGWESHPVPDPPLGRVRLRL